MAAFNMVYSLKVFKTSWQCWFEALAYVCVNKHVCMGADYQSSYIQVVTQVRTYKTGTANFTFPNFLNFHSTILISFAFSISCPWVMCFTYTKEQKRRSLRPFPRCTCMKVALYLPQHYWLVTWGNIVPFCLGRMVAWRMHVCVPHAHKCTTLWRWPTNSLYAFAWM